MRNPWLHVDRGTPDECWLWTGQLDSKGYGKTKVKRKSMGAHRFIYSHVHGKIPPNLYVCHSCDTPRCCNPFHLFLGTAADNSRDAVSKGRIAFGERASRAKLTEKDVAEIRRLAREGRKRKDIASQFGITPPNVGFIVKRQTWKHLA